jgi:transcription elongation GreA/GreB family factor
LAGNALFLVFSPFFGSKTLFFCKKLMDLGFKEQLLNHCKQLVEQKIQTAQQAMDAAQQAANEETKSSAGDKYETGRAMMQMERDKNALQLAEAIKLKTVLEQINIQAITSTIQFGSLVQTAQANYFLAASLGKVKIDQSSIYAISAVSPIGQKMIGLKKGDSFSFNGNQLVIQEVF